ncbi:MAG: PfkB family carbohydrate kinase [Oscillospiraceae bacterium]
MHTFKPNLTEGQNLTGESTPEGIVAALLAQGVQRVFLSMGSDGILAGTCGELVHLPCLPTCMVNTTGGRRGHGGARLGVSAWARSARERGGRPARRQGHGRISRHEQPRPWRARPRLRRVKNGKNSRLPKPEACCFFIAGQQCGRQLPPHTMRPRMSQWLRPACRAGCRAPAAWPPAPPRTARTAP